MFHPQKGGGIGFFFSLYSNIVVSLRNSTATKFNIPDFIELGTIHELLHSKRDFKAIWDASDVALCTLCIISAVLW